jgi:hypothetical protein
VEGTENDFLTREKAVLGDDAAQFSTPGDNLATVEDGDDDDLLGGDESYGQPAADSSFESSFPAIDTRNEV